jgi:hypothetical protein
MKKKQGEFLKQVRVGDILFLFKDEIPVVVTAIGLSRFVYIPLELDKDIIPPDEVKEGVSVMFTTWKHKPIKKILSKETRDGLNNLASYYIKIMDVNKKDIHELEIGFFKRMLAKFFQLIGAKKKYDTIR